MSKYTPNGLSIQQIKKDAKKLKKAKNISLSEARNIITKEKTDFESWDSMQNYLFKNGNVIEVLSFNTMEDKKEKLTIYEEKPLTIIHAKPGYGKSFFIVNLLQNEKPEECLIANTEGSDRFQPYNELDLIEKYNFKGSYEEMISKSVNDFHMINILNELKKGKTKTLAIDEINRLLDINSLEDSFFNEILDYCSKKNIKVIIATQLFEIEKFEKIVKNYTSNIIDLNNSKILENETLSMVKVENIITKTEKKSIFKIKRLNKK
tara:strand:+ start:15223 stop:16014 length:792 start_codon:yes stop_codon:yes gene_type:complete